MIRDAEDFNINIIQERYKVRVDDMKASVLVALEGSANKSKIDSEKELTKAIDHAGIGDLASKNFIKDNIITWLTTVYKIDETNIDKILEFTRPTKLSSQDRFEILLKRLQREYGYHAFLKLLEFYNLDTLRIDDQNVPKYYITDVEIEKVYNHVSPKLTFVEKLQVIAQRIYSNLYGLGVIDELRDMILDGVSGGVSGIPVDFLDGLNSASVEMLNLMHKNYDSVWTYVKGKQVQLAFLSFGSEKELVRVAQNCSRFDNAEELTKSKGYLINVMADGSRVDVHRPPLAESWCFFIRKKMEFGNLYLEDETINGEVRKVVKTKLLPLESLIKGKNSDVVIKLLKFFVKGYKHIALTGEQGTGKTTMLIAIIHSISAFLTLRIWETAFELFLRMQYPHRNIMSLRETSNVDGQTGIDSLKKTDGNVTIIGEIAEAKVASIMVQVAQVASLFTLFTHHAKTPDALVRALRNSLLQVGIFSDENTAEEEVIHALKFNVHLKAVNGLRFIDHITEIIPAPPIKIPKGSTESDVRRATIEYYRSLTSGTKYIKNVLIKYDIDTHTYNIINPISRDCAIDMFSNMLEDDRELFKQFLLDTYVN